MRKLGIFLIIIGIIQLVVNIISTTKRGFDLEMSLISSCFILIGSCLFLVGNHKRKVALSQGKRYHEMGWGKVIGIFFTIMFGIAIIGRVALSITESSFDGQIKKANKICPIPVAGGMGEIVSIASLDNMIIYTLIYDDKAINLDRIIASPEEYKKVIILSSYLLNGQKDNGDKFIDMILQHNYGIAFKVKSNNGADFTISASNQELRLMLDEAKKSPTEAMKSILEWQINDGQASLPTKLDDEMTLDAILCDTSNLIYRVTVFEPITITNIRDNNTSDLRTEILKGLYSDPASKANIDMCSVGKFNVIYRYVNPTKTDSCDIVFTHDEIQKITKLPKQLNFK